MRSDNIAAIKLYEKFGFEKIGRFRGFFKINGEFIDFDIMQKFI
ncbi:GNAT family N-acetyltransferase [Treponema saccharophilum]